MHNKHYITNTYFAELFDFICQIETYLHCSTSYNTLELIAIVIMNKRVDFHSKRLIFRQLQTMLREYNVNDYSIVTLYIELRPSLSTR